MMSLVGAFAVQSYLVYTDDTALDVKPLSETALAGQTLWRRNNCQSCHQIYGFGGFLGPDLTNAAGRLTRDRLDEVLTEGVSPMPAYHFSEEEIDAIDAYLHSLDSTGVGQARRAPPVDMALLAAAIDEQARRFPLGTEAEEGRVVFEGTCSVCHTLFQPTALGPFLAPDLSAVADRVPAAEIDEVLSMGRPARGMPASGLGEHERHCVLQFFEWVATHRADLMPPNLEGSDGLPWWEYR